MREAIAGRFVGAKVQRVEDPRLLTGTGRYVDDIAVPDMLHAAFARSPHPHALIRTIDTDAARRLPGVVAVFTGADIAKLTNPFIGLLPLPSLYNPVHYALATDRVRLVGDPVAMVVATSRYVGRGRRGARGRRLRTARADRHHRPGARPSPTADLARRTR